MFEDADPYNRGEITYEALKNQLHKHGGLLENLSITWVDRWTPSVHPFIRPAMSVDFENVYLINILFGFPPVTFLQNWSLAGTHGTGCAGSKDQIEVVQFYTHTSPVDSGLYEE